MRGAIPILLVLLSGAASSQSAGDGWQELMRNNRSGYPLPDPDRVLTWPADHGPHEAFALEWWYLTANLRAEDGRAFGMQWTLFRNRISPEDGEGWQSPQVFLAHAALGSRTEHLSDEKWARGSIGTAGVRLAPFAAWIDDWRWESPGPDPFPARLRFDVRGRAVDLELRAHGPLVLQGQNGFSIKNAAGTLASHYYSQPFVQLEGTIRWHGEDLNVSGPGWFDREWSSQFLDGDQSGWDWFSVHVADGHKLMVFQVRGPAEPFRHGVWISPDGGTRKLAAAEISLTPSAPRRLGGAGPYPMRWRIQIPGLGLDVETEPLNEDSLMRLNIQYWEGAIRVTGSHAGTGFLEMTGY